jgi:diguanylate cyclase (GGDEF)-like protein
MPGADEIVMSDSETPQDNRDNPGRELTPGPHAGEQPSSAPRPHFGNQPSPANPEPVAAPSPDGAPAPAPAASLGQNGLGRVAELVRSRKLLLSAVALLCIVAGTVASLLGAHAVANSHANERSSNFQQGSAAVASALKLAIQREEELAVSASTFFANNPKASPAEFARWVKWARTLHRFPELDNLSLLTLVRKPQLAAFAAQLSGHALKPATSIAATGGGTATGAATATTTAGTATAPAKALRVVPASNHHYYCLTSAELVRSAALSAPAGLDYCARNPALLYARDEGRSRYAPVTVGHERGLTIDTPVYRGNVTPLSVFGRTAASVGWLREVLLPGVVLAQVLKGHPAIAASINYSAGGANVTYTSGTSQSGGQSATTSLHDGWTVTSYAAAPDVSVFSDGASLALMIGGIVLSLLVGVLVLGLGTPPTPDQQAQVQTPEEPRDDLHDALTGLPNRPLMMDRAECMLARAGRQSGLLVGALFIDVDWFKDVNEKLGRDAGDQLLKNVAERLDAVVRAGDTVGRLGDDEFVILVESAARGARLDALARRVIEALHKPFELADFGPNFFMTASIGLAFGRYANPDDLLRDAQLALHAAKAAGKDRYTLFNANMRSVIEGRGVLEVELNAALADDQFALLYQPIYDLRTGKVAGLEARIRWEHPKRGDVAPGEFIPLAEETGLIVPIGRWVMEEACNRAAAWNVAGHRVGVSVKVSAAQLNRGGFSTDVLRALQQSGIEPSLLTLEIAEATVMGDVSASVARLEEIKRLGVRIAIDDFGGSGYAHHGDLRRLPIDFLKVDRSSLAAAEDEDYRSWLLEAILIVGRDLSLTVVAKGIETYEQMTTLQAMGCTMAQGLFMGKPTQVDGVESLFEVDLPAAGATGQAS